MKIIKDNEELKSYIVDGVAKFNESIECNFDICIDADIEAFNITASEIKARNIKAWDIKANEIKAGDITSSDITASDITAGDIKANDITASDITANDINYWSYCIALSSLKCSSIKGGRFNSIHKCLDSPIEIIKKKTEINLQGNKFSLSLEELNNLKQQIK